MKTACMGLLLATAVISSGCIQPACPKSHWSLERLVEEHNANAGRVERLWGRANIRVQLSATRTWGSTSPLAPPNGYLMLAKPAQPATAASTPKAQPALTILPPAQASFALIGKEAAVELFRLGVDQGHGVYYFWYKLGSEGKAWFGRTALAGAPGIQDVPINPLQLMEVLGVTPLPPVRGLALPAAVLRMQTSPRCAYVVQCLSPQPITGVLKLWREVYFTWSDKEQPRPYQVKLYDTDGLVGVVADVGKFQPIAGTGGEGVCPAMMPTQIRLAWQAIEGVQKPGSLELRLSELSATHAFADSVFEFGPPGVEVEQVDAGIALHGSVAQ